MGVYCQLYSHVNLLGAVHQLRGVNEPQVLVVLHGTAAREDGVSALVTASLQVGVCVKRMGMCWLGDGALVGRSRGRREGVLECE